MSSVTARRIAELKGLSWEDFHRNINQNTRRFFGLDPDAIRTANG
jgi:Tat protein secretion system quality control protein TatD with DNase activity